MCVNSHASPRAHQIRPQTIIRDALCSEIASLNNDNNDNMIMIRLYVPTEETQPVLADMLNIYRNQFLIDRYWKCNNQLLHTFFYCLMWRRLWVWKESIISNPFSFVLQVITLWILDPSSTEILPAALAVCGISTCLHILMDKVQFQHNFCFAFLNIIWIYIMSQQEYNI